MTEKTLKEYIKLNRIYLSAGKDTLQSEKSKAYFEDIKEIRGFSTRYKEICSKFSSGELLEYKETSVCFFLFSCILTVLFSLPVMDDGKSFFDAYDVAAMAVMWVSSVLLVLRYLFLGHSCRYKFLLFIGTASRVILAVLCTLAPLFIRFEFFGSNLGWLYVYIIGGVLNVLFIRGCEYLFFIRHYRKENRDGIKEIEKINRTIDRAVKSFETFNKEEEVKLKELIAAECPGVTLTHRNCWIDIYGSDSADSYSISRCATDFVTPFPNRRLKCGPYIVTYDAHSQFMGFEEIALGEAERLVSSGEMKPFFNLGLPELIPGLKYEVYRHKWDITKVVEFDNYYSFKVQTDSQAQKDFDSRTSLREITALGDTVDHLESDDYFTQRKIDKYREKKEEIRSSIGYDVKTQHGHSHRLTVYECKGDEIAMLTVRDSEGELLGLYCADNYDSIRLAIETAVKESDFRISALLSTNSYSQRAYLYGEYILGSVRTEEKEKESWTDSDFSKILKEYNEQNCYGEKIRED